MTPRDKIIPQPETPISGEDDLSRRMNEEKDNGSARVISAPRASRRRFIQKSSSVALITTLAAQPVWGQCTVSGATSGGSGPEEGDDPCVIPNVSGRSPGFWSEAMYSGNAVRSAFPVPPANESAKLRCYIDLIKNSSSFDIPSTGENWKVVDALKIPGGLKFNLAAIWLDAHFGFFTVPLPGVDNALPQDWVNHFDALYQLSGDAVFDAVFDDEDSSTNWNGQLLGC